MNFIQRLESKNETQHRENLNLSKQEDKMTCDHYDFEAIGKFPENMEIEGEYMFNKIKCLDCGQIGKEYYQFTDRTWKN